VALTATGLFVITASGVAFSAHLQGNVLDKSPLSSSVLMARAIKQGKIILPGGGSAANSLSPNATILPNVRAAGNGTQPTNENPLTADPTTPSHLLSGANDYNCSALQGFYSSDDSGAHWRSHCLPVVGAGGCGDPDVAYDTLGNSYILGIGDCNGFTGSIVLSKSNNNGVNWTPPRVVIRPLFSGGITDKEWTEVDHSATSPFKDSIYTSITQFDSSSNSAISVSISRDGGQTFTTKQVDQKQIFPNSVDQFSDLAIAADGTIYVSWIRCPWNSGPTGDCGSTVAKLLVSKSTDGGMTWSAPVQIAQAKLAADTSGCGYGCFPGTGERVSDIPAIDVDDSTGKLWVGFYNNIGGTLTAFLTSSSDGGATWSTPAQVGSSGNQGWIWTASNDAGGVAVSFLQSGAPGSYVAAVALTKNGTTFNRMKTSTTPQPMLFANDGQGGFFIGDYTGGIWTGNTYHQSWMDTRNGSTSQDFTGGVSFP
jgi:hypothetical protein